MYENEKDLPEEAAPDGEPVYPAEPEAYTNPEEVSEPDGTTPSPASPPRKRTNLGAKILLGAAVAGIIAFAVFCVIEDTKGGISEHGFYPASDVVKVTIQQQKKSNKDPELTDENGNYTFEGIAQAVMPSIVEIYTYRDGMPLGTGSGIILSKEGYIATNAHVVDGADEYSVILYDMADENIGQEAALIGRDNKTDLAVLKIAAGDLRPAVLGDSDEMRLGETVCALGNPADLSFSMTTGIISGTQRKVRAQQTNLEMECFQTDAAISPGNSGGALVNMEGQVIGITSSKYSNSIFNDASYEGLGFAITINEAIPILTELMEQGYVSGRVRIGIQFWENEVALADAKENGVELPSELNGCGIQILGLDEDSDLRNTPLQPNDWILKMNGKNVSDYDSVNAAIEGASAGDVIHCTCARVEENGTLHTFEIDFHLLADQSGDY